MKETSKELYEAYEIALKKEKEQEIKDNSEKLNCQYGKKVFCLVSKEDKIITIIYYKKFWSYKPFNSECISYSSEELTISDYDSKKKSGYSFFGKNIEYRKYSSRNFEFNQLVEGKEIPLRLFKDLVSITKTRCAAFFEEALKLIEESDNLNSVKETELDLTENKTLEAPTTLDIPHIKIEDNQFSLFPNNVYLIRKDSHSCYLISPESLVLLENNLDSTKDSYLRVAHLFTLSTEITRCETVLNNICLLKKKISEIRNGVNNETV